VASALSVSRAGEVPRESNIPLSPASADAVGVACLPGSTAIESACGGPGGQEEVDKASEPASPRGKEATE
jgi:hypothetical protein